MPYVWSLVVANSLVPWNLAAVALLSPLKADEPPDSRPESSLLLSPRRTDESELQV